MAVNFDAAAVETTFCRDVVEVCQMLSEQGIPQDTICDEEQKESLLTAEQTRRRHHGADQWKPQEEVQHFGKNARRVEIFLVQRSGSDRASFSDNGLAENHLQALAKAETFVISLSVICGQYPESSAAVSDRDRHLFC